MRSAFNSLESSLPTEDRNGLGLSKYPFSFRCRFEMSLANLGTVRISANGEAKNLSL